MFWTIIIFLLTICVLVTVHEFGHFIIAKLCGVKIESFSIGFGKKLLSYTGKSGTKYSLSILPLGGYVKMLDGRGQQLTEEDKAFAFDQQSISKRVAIISAGPVANFILAIIIYWIVFQLGIITYPVKVASIIPNTPAASVNIPQDVELKTIADIKIESWADVNSILITEMGKPDIVLSYITQDNQLHQQSININNWRFDIEKESPIKAFGFVPEPVVIYPIISKIVGNSAANKAGLLVGDEIVAYNGKLFDNWLNFAELIKNAKPMTLTIKRSNKTIQLDFQPDSVTDGDGNVIGVAGIYPSNSTIVKQYDIVDAFIKGFNQTALTVNQVTRSFYQLLTGVISIKNLSGPISIAKGAGQTANYGAVPYLFFLAFISVSLGVINLIPLPMLDGGHLLFLLIEKIKGSPLSVRLQEEFYRLGFVLLIIIMAVALFNDFVRL